MQVELPEKVDVLIHEIIGEIASQEGVVVALRDALPRFGMPGGCVSIPDRVRSFLTPVMYPDYRFWNKREQWYARARDPATLHRQKIPSFKIASFPAACLLSQPQPFENIPFNEGVDAIPVMQETELSFKVNKHGVFEGMLVHVELDLDSKSTINSCSWEHRGCSWDNIFVMTPEHMEVQVAS